MRLDVQFNPFTYEELIRPIADYNEAYKEVEEAYSILSEQAEAFRSEVNQHKNSEAYKTHSKYSNELNAIVDDFSQGMTRANRAKLLGMKRRYNTEIAPIAKAAARRSALAEEQRKMELANPTMLWERMASDMSLDEFINNPSADYGRSYSGAMLTQQVANAAANLAKEARDSEEGRRKLKRILPYTYDMIQQNGFSHESVMKAILGSPDADSILTGLVDNALITSGIGTTNNPGWGNDAIRAKAYEYARQGLYNAIGQTTHQVIRDEAGLADNKNNANQNNANQNNAIALSGVSYLHSNGDAARYTSALAGLKAGSNSVKASVFGKNGRVNPITVYNEYQNEVANINSRHTTTYIPGESSIEYGVRAMGEAAIRKTDKKKEIESAKKRIMQKYGVSEIITPDQVEALTAIGYKGEQVLKYSDFSNKLNNLVQQRAYYSTNMSEYSVADNNIRAQLGNWESLGQFSGKVYKLKSDGSQGAAVEYDDLNLKTDDNSLGREITGIYYSAYTPDKIIVQVGQSGERYLMDPNILGTSAAQLISGASSDIASGMDKTEASILTTQYLAHILNGYNQTASKSSSNAN